MKYNITALAATLLICMTACVSENLEIHSTADRLTVAATHMAGGLPTTKTILTPYTEGVHVAWAENDKIRIMRANAETYTSVDLLLKEGAGEQTATFEGNNFPDVSNASNIRYQAFYPATIEGSTPTIWKGNATYEGQIQKGNDNSNHLAAFDYLTTQQVDNLEQPLKFMHLGLVFCFDITVPDSESAPQSFTLTTVNDDNTPTTEGGLFKDCNRTKTSSLTLNFQECSATNTPLKAYMMCNCNIPASQKVLATLSLQDGSNYTSLMTAKQIISGTPSNGNNEGICYVIPISNWNKAKNCVFDANTKAEEYTGSGTQENPYIIESAENLKYLIEGNDSFTGKYFSLATDITIQDGITWTPIGSSTPFSGHFDGKGHTIKGELNVCPNKNIGLFGETKGATIHDLNSEINITNETCENVGGIIAKATSTTITDCHYNGNICAGTNSNSTYAGGIVGLANSNCQINNCSSRGSIKQNSITLTNDIYLGGIVAKAYSPTISKCYNYAEIKGGKHNGSPCTCLGGIIGKSYKDNIQEGKIEGCYNYGEIYGCSFICFKHISSPCNLGGVVGEATKAKITQTYNYGAIHAQPSEHCNYTGGIIGNIVSGGDITLDNCSNHGEVIGYASNKQESNIQFCTGGLIGKIGNTSYKVHQCHNAGNVSVVTDSPKSTNIYVGSYVGHIYGTSFIYTCCSTASGVIIKGANGETISSSQPNYYIGNELSLIDCPDNHATPSE